MFDIPMRRGTTALRAAQRFPLAAGAIFHWIAPVPDTAATVPSKSGNRWRSHIGSAKLTWPKLSSHELERIDGQQGALVKLLLRHHSFSRDEAEQQVRRFFERNRV